jgi:hypothetical protein
MAPKPSYILTEAQKAKRLEEIKGMLKDMLKVIKVVSMYPPGNPLPQSMRRNFAERLAQHIEDYGAVQILVGRDTLTCDGETVFIDKTKEEALAALFFDTGVTSFTFMESFDIENIYKLLDVIKAYINSPDKSQDLANLLWESGISRFTFTTLEDIALAEYQGDFNVEEYDQARPSLGGAGQAVFGTDEIESYAAIFSQSTDGDSDSSDKRKSSDGDSEGNNFKVGFRGGRRSPGASANHQFYAVNADEAANPLADIAGIDGVSFRAAEAADAMGLANLPAATAPRANTALILNDELRLSEEDEREVAAISARDAEFDMWESTLELLKELLHQETELPDFTETVGICSKVGTEFIRAGKLWHAAQLIQYITVLEDQIRRERPQWADKLADARNTFGSRERMEILGESLNLHQDIGSDELRRYLAAFDWQALAAITDLLGDLELESHREAVCDYLTTAGRSHLQLLSRGVTDKRPQAVRGAIIVLSRIGDAQSFGILKKAATNEDRSVRLELVTQLKDCPGPEALSILKLAATDKDSEIRRAAIASISAQRGVAAFDAVGEIIVTQEFILMEDEDKQRILNAYSALGGEEAVPHLSNLIRRMNPFRNPIISSLRKGAFEALCHNRSERSERLLVGLANSWRPDIRQQAQAALKRRREIIFGGRDE